MSDSYYADVDVWQLLLGNNMVLKWLDFARGGGGGKKICTDPIIQYCRVLNGD